jgi:hypothetical protein
MLPIDSDMFFGREAEMQHILDALTYDYPQSVSILGERRIGKTSLALRAFHQLTNLKNTQAVFIDCDRLSGECKTKEEFFQFLDREFGAKNSLFNDYPSFNGFIREKGRAGHCTIIFLDEFDHFPAITFADDTFFSNLRAAAADSRNRLAFVTISKRHLKDLTHRSIQTSTFWNIFQPEMIGLLNHNSITQLRTYGFESTDLKLKEKEVEKIHYYAGDFPFFNQLACWHLWRAKTDRVAMEWNRLEMELFPYYQGLWQSRTMVEQKLLKREMNRKTNKYHEMNNLRSRGLVIKTGKGYQPFSAFFSQLLHSKFKILRKKSPVKQSLIAFLRHKLGV